MKKTLGSVAGAVGLLLVLTSVITFLVTVGSLVLFAVKLGLGVALLIFWALTARTGDSALIRRASYFSSSIGMGLAFIGLLAALNFITARKAPTWDLTAKKIFSLSDQTVKTLEGLKQPVKIIGFFEGPAPEVVENLFKRYQEVGDKFSYEFKDPRKEWELTAKYQIRQGQPAAVLISGEQHSTVSMQRLVTGQLAEQELTNGIIKLQAVGSQKLYILSGHGEVPLEPQAQTEEAMASSLMALSRLLSDEGYAPEQLNLIDAGLIPADASALVIAGARTKFSDGELTLLEQYLNEGGRLLYFAEAQATSGVEPLLAKYGVQVEPGIVADSRVNPNQPYIVYTPFLSEHAISRALKAQQMNVIFATSRALTVLHEDTLPGVKAEPLVLTTPYAWADLNPGENPEAEDGERTGQLPLAVAVTRDVQGEAKRADETRVVVFGDSDLLAGTLGHPPNLNLVFNAVAWATQQVQKITIRPPDRDISTFELTPGQAELIRVIAIDLLPTALLALGLSIWLSRRSR